MQYILNLSFKVDVKGTNDGEFLDFQCTLFNLSFKVDDSLFLFLIVIMLSKF